VNFVVPALRDLTNESDVEQKLIFPLLVSDPPYGLGLSGFTILTKANIRRFPIGKGNDRKSYFPDYLVVSGGFPLVVLEAKTPGEDVDEGFREARLYAAELNAIFAPGVNPLTRVVATDGARLVAGSWDHAEPSVHLSLPELEPSSEKMAKLYALIGRTSLESDFRRLSTIVKPTKLWKPRRLLGGESVQQEEIGQNTFGATIATEFAHVFNPSSQDDRIRIATEGYIPSRRRERYVDPIDRVIRASRQTIESHSNPIDDTSNPKELIVKLRDQRPLEHQVLLIVGSVGSGKSTFVDHLQYAALPREIVNTTVWVRVNMNNAPSANAEIYDWLRTEIIGGCRAAYPDVDFDQLHRLKALFSVEVRAFDKGVGQLYRSNKDIYDLKLAEYLEGLLGDLHKQAIAYTRHCSTERGKLLILVLDNCDKRTRDQQLLMFEAAQWIQKEFRALVILPLREETYDNHRDQPPLDTALKDLVFRIEAPLFHNVLVSRVQLALNELKRSGDKTYHYELPNGFHVEYAASDKAFYLSSIVNAVFSYDKQIRRMIVGLAARNIRRALEIFLEFCSSGHITEDHIFRIRQSEGQYLLPLSVVVRVLLRTNRRFYDSDRSYIKNLLAIDAQDSRPNYLTRLILLRWLFIRFSQQGPSGQKGYFPVRDAVQELTVYGIEKGVVRREVEYLTKSQIILTEDFRTEQIEDEDLIRLGPAGFVHLELLGIVDYLAAVAEDTWFSDEEVAYRVAERINGLEQHYNANTSIANAREVVDLMELVESRDSRAISSVLESSSYGELTDIQQLRSGIDAFERSLTAKPWQDLGKRYPIGAEATGVVSNVKDFGVFVELEPGVTGLIPASRLPYGFSRLDHFSIGEHVIVRPLNIDGIARRMGLTFVRPAEAVS
jgi:energy-coupling factor transporter ATP-binding protein EcfA2